MGGDVFFAVTLGRALDAIPDLAADAPMMSPSAGQTEHENATGGSEGVSMARALFKSFVANLTGETTDVPSPDTAFEASKSRQRERNPSAKHAVSPTGGQNRSATPVPTAAQPVSAPAWLPVYQGNSFPAQAETPEVERKYDDAVQASNVEPAPGARCVTAVASSYRVYARCCAIRARIRSNRTRCAWGFVESTRCFRARVCRQ